MTELSCQDETQGDFFWGLDFTPAFYARLFAHGFLPISTSIHFPPEGYADRVFPILPSLRATIARSSDQDSLYILLPKLHKQRCVIRWDKLHVSKNARKRSKRFRVSFDQAFDDVVAACIEQHGEEWLFPPVVAALRTLHLQPNRVTEVPGSPVVRVHSVEVGQGDKMVAGELGYVVGAVYTSLTGFYTVASAGTIQMLAMAGLLRESGFGLWDLGMALPYKMRLGAENLPRGKFLSELARLRRRECAVRVDGKPPSGQSVSAAAAIRLLDSRGATGPGDAKETGLRSPPAKRKAAAVADDRESGGAQKASGAAGNDGKKNPAGRAAQSTRRRKAKGEAGAVSGSSDSAAS